MKLVHSLLLAACCGLLLGCPSKDGGEYSDAPAGDEHDHHAGHVHGPHDGELLELVKDKYHAELVVDGEKSVTVYILDKDKKAAPIEAESIMLVIKEDDEDEEFEVSAKPEEGEGDGKSSRFVYDDESTVDHLIHDMVKHDTHVVVTLDGKEEKAEMKAGTIHHEHEDGDEDKGGDEDGDS